MLDFLENLWLEYVNKVPNMVTKNPCVNEKPYIAILNFYT